MTEIKLMPLFPNEIEYEEHQREIDVPNTRDFPIGKDICYWCGARIKKNESCPGCEDVDTKNIIVL